MNHRIACLLSSAVLSLAGATASAGQMSPVPVTIDFVTRTASGDMYTARTSSNPFEFIGCGVRHVTGGTKYAFCQAGIGEAEGQFFTCFTFDPDLVEAVHAISTFSYVVFRWDVDGNCTQIGNSTQSFYVPDLKAKAPK